MVSCEVLENGEQALFYRYDGKVSLKKGPKRVNYAHASSNNLIL